MREIQHSQHPQHIPHHLPPASVALTHWMGATPYIPAVIAADADRLPTSRPVVVVPRRWPRQQLPASCLRQAGTERISGEGSHDPGNNEVGPFFGLQECLDREDVLWHAHGMADVGTHMAWHPIWQIPDSQAPLRLPTPCPEIDQSLPPHRVLSARQASRGGRGSQFPSVSLWFPLFPAHQKTS